MTGYTDFGRVFSLLQETDTAGLETMRMDITTNLGWCSADLVGTRSEKKTAPRRVMFSVLSMPTVSAKRTGVHQLAETWPRMVLQIAYGVFRFNMWRSFMFSSYINLACCVA